MATITLRQPLNLQIGGGLDKDGKRRPIRVIALGVGTHEVSDEVASHDFVRALTSDQPRPVGQAMFSPEQMQVLEGLGLSPQQRELLSRVQQSPEQRAAAGAPGLESMRQAIEGDKEKPESTDDKTEAADDKAEGGRGRRK